MRFLFLVLFMATSRGLDLGTAAAWTLEATGALAAADTSSGVGRGELSPAEAESTSVTPLGPDPAPWRPWALASLEESLEWMEVPFTPEMERWISVVAFEAYTTVNSIVLAWPPEARSSTRAAHAALQPSPGGRSPAASDDRWLIADYCVDLRAALHQSRTQRQLIQALSELRKKYW